MLDHSPLAPEERRKRLASLEAQFGHGVVRKLKPGAYPFEVVKRIAVGVYNDGFVHAGNLAFLSLLALFPFFIPATALATNMHLYWVGVAADPVRRCCRSC